MSLWYRFKRLFRKKPEPLPFTYLSKEILEEMGACLRFDEFGKEREIPKGEGKVITFRRYQVERNGMETRAERREPGRDAPSGDGVGGEGI